MSIISFGEFSNEHGYKVLDERAMRGSAGIMLLLAIIASINGFIIKDYIVIPFITGFLVLNFLIGLLINPKYSPTVLLARLFVIRQNVLPIGAIQKKFAWSLGLVLSTAIFVLSLFLQSNEAYFGSVCLLCLTCILFLYLETAFGICVGCQIYTLGVRFKIFKAPQVTPNCMGDSCKVN
jgi:hypothetical protein